MQNNYPNKAMQSNQVPNKGEVISPPLQEFHFSGKCIYKPQIVQAKDIKEATEIYEKTRKKVVEDDKLINNNK